MAKKILTVFLLLILVTALYAREDVSSYEKNAPGDNPKVALVLAGGGALGFAHIGVLKVLEENGIRPDCVAGTSMGGLVGALYAYGYSPESIESMVKDIDWVSLFIDAKHRRFVPYRDRFTYSKYFFDLAFDWHGIRSNQGLASGQKILNFFNAVVGPCSQDMDFDDLEIPFRAVSADILTGEQYVFDHGALSDAMRCTMSIPGIFDPVEYDGQLLVDGMVVNNLPVSVAKDMGADIVIAVNLGSKEIPRENMRNSIGVASQMLNLYIKEEVERQLEMADLAIHPELGDYTSVSYFKVEEIIAAGEEAARKMMPQIKELLTEHQSRPPLEMPDRTSLFIDRIRFSGVSERESKILSEYICGYEQSVLDVNRLNKDIEDIYSTGYFASIRPYIEQDEDETVLNIDFHQDNSGPNYFRAGVFYEYNSNVHEDMTLNILLDLELNDVLFEDSTISSEMELFSGFKWDLDYFIPFKDYFFVRPKFVISYLPEKREYISGDRYGEGDFFNMQSSLDVGTFSNILGEMSAGFMNEYMNYDYSDRFPHDHFRGMVNSLFFRSRLDNVNSVSMPEYGTMIDLLLKYSDVHLGSEDTYLKAIASIWQYFQFCERHSVGFKLYGEMDFATDLPYYDMTTPSYINVFPGYSNRELTYPNLLSGIIDYKFNFFQLHPMEDQLSKFFIIARAGIAFGYDDFDLFTGDHFDMLYGYGLGLGVSTLFGPVFFEVSMNDNNRFMAHISIGTKF
ncbi:MAG: patatin-like phospholipase family protein [Spirochaetia bacterium]|nr:patatin-like phospholipase family protein [Spirochaetia bacterium]